MIIDKKKYLKLFFLIILTLLIYVSVNKINKDKNEAKALEPIVINLLTSVHPNLTWSFKPIESKIKIKPGEVTTIKYEVENLGSKNTTSIATFAYFPNVFGEYISKINCFCYDAKTLKPGQKDTYTVVILLDPAVTKDSKTKNVKEATIQFTFFDYKEYQESKS